MDNPRTLTYDEAQHYYDRFGRKQDSQSFYEQRAVDLMCAHADLGAATSVVELGCGTGKLAASLLKDELAQSTRYLGLDLSSTMIGLAEQRLKPFGDRAHARKVDGSLPLPIESGSADRFLATYVFDLLSPEDMDAMLDEAHRVLAPGGLLGVAGLTPGTGGVSRMLSRTWTAIHRWKPALVGGCRPIRLSPRLDATRWNVRLSQTVVAVGIASEVLVAQRLPS